MPVVAPTAVRVRTSSGWVDVALVGPPGPAGASGAVVIYEQPNTPPVNAPIGSVWIDTDDPLPTPGTGPAGPAGPPGPQGPTGGNATVLMDIWHQVGSGGEPSFQNGWVSYGVDRPPKFRKTPDGRVQLSGAAKTGTNNTVVFTLPVGYRPAVVSSFIGYFSGGTGQITILTDGTITLANMTGTGATQASLDEVEFDTETVIQMQTGPQGPAGPAGGSAYTGQIGDGTNSIFVVTHNLATRNVTVAVYRTVAPNDEIVCDVERTDANTVTIRTGSTVPTAGQYTVIVAAPGTISNPPAIPPPLVTTAPASPVDGQEFYFLSPDDGGGLASIMWRFRYRASSGQTFKWECVGGVPMLNGTYFDEDTARGGSLSTVPTVMATLTVPLAGDYLYDWNATQNAQVSVTETHAALYKNGVVIANTRRSWSTGGYANDKVDRGRLIGLAKNDVITLNSWIDANSSATGIWSRSLSLMPVRVG